MEQMFAMMMQNQLGNRKMTPQQKMMKQMMEMFAASGGMGGGMSGGMRGGMGGGDSTHMALVNQVKQLQKTEEGKQAWIEFVQENGGGKRDPALRPIQQLKQFLGSAGDGADVFNLADQIKQGQKISDEYRQAWYSFLDENGQSDKDPMRHDADFLQSFLDSAPEYSIPGADDPQHAQLAENIKAGQRVSQEYKEAWHEFCSSNGYEKFDPTYHESSFMRRFLKANPAPANVGTVATMGGSKRKGQEKGASMMPRANSASKQALVDAIKEGQRGSEEYKETWRAYCREQGGTSKYDPAIRDEDFLQGFLQSMGDPAPAKKQKRKGAWGW